MVSRIIPLFLLLITWLPLFSIQYPFINYQTSHGLPQNFVTALAQDHQGYIWIGTQSGIGIFDGQEFSIISARQGLPGNYINDFAIDKSGQVWVATDFGVACLKKTVVRHTYLSGFNVKKLQFNRKSQCIWALAENRLFVISEKSHRFELSEDNREIIDFCFNSDGTVFVAYANRILLLDNNGKKIVIPGSGVCRLKKLAAKVYLVTKNRVSVFHNKKFRFFCSLPPDCGKVTDIAADTQQNIWAGTSEGLLFYHSHQKKWQIFRKKNGLHNDRINRVLVDREGTLFAATYFGLSQLPAFRFRMYDADDGVPSEFVTCMLEEPSGAILIGGHKGIAEIKNGKVKQFSINSALKDYSVRSILRLNESNYLLGTRNHGIFLWNRQSSLKNISPGARVMCGIKDSLNTCWFGCNKGILRFKDNRFTLFSTGMPNTQVWKISQYLPGTLIIGTRKGLHFFSKEKIIFHPLSAQLKDLSINDIYVSSTDEIYVATELKGLYIYKNGKTENLSTANGLFHNDVWFVLKDDSDNIWLNTSVSLVRYRNGFFSHFNRTTGLFGDEGFIHSSLKSKSGELYFGINPGIVNLSTININHKFPRPEPSLRSLKVNGVMLESASPLVLGFSQNNIEFDFLAVSTRKENPIYYKYRLLPVFPQWSEPSRKSHASFLNMSPGKYSFQMMANNSSLADQWISSKSDFTFIIKKPFWQTLWFISLFAVFFFSLLKFLINLRVKVLRKQKKKLEFILNEHTLELARKNHELSYLSLTDPLTGLRNRRFFSEKIKEELSLVNRNLFKLNQSVNTDKNNVSPLLLAFIIVDIDNFKQVNDFFGHHTGDQVLTRIANILKNELRTSDTIIRWGGEEFLIIARTKNQLHTFTLAERIRTHIADITFPVSENDNVKKTVSIGFAHYPFIAKNPKIISWHQVISIADSALLSAKSRGRNKSLGVNPGKTFLDHSFSDIIVNFNNYASLGIIELIEN